MSDKPRFPRADAMRVARELCDALEPVCESEHLKVCGSLRRGKLDVGDVELVYVPRVESRPGPADLFGNREFRPVNLVDEVLEKMLRDGIIERRLNVNGSPAWGALNKLARHVASGIPVDLFATTRRAWWSYIVCRTGSAKSNTAIATAAQRKQMTWHPYEGHFTDCMGREIPIVCEQDAFHIVGLPYKEPRDR